MEDWAAKSNSKESVYVSTGYCLNCVECKVLHYEYRAFSGINAIAMYSGQYVIDVGIIYLRADSNDLRSKEICKNYNSGVSNSDMPIQ